MELFAGIGGFRIACDRTDINTIWANDLSESACEVYRSRFGDGEIVQGDLSRLAHAIPRHDLLTAGFPCQPFSSAGKKLGIDDPRGTLFQFIVDILRSKKPRFFLLENVKRLLTMEQGRHFATILSALSSLEYQIEWRLVNAMDLGLAQNRQRVFIAGTKISTTEESRLKISLASESELLDAPNFNPEIFYAPSAWFELDEHHKRFPSWGVARDGRFCSADLGSIPDAKPVVRLGDVLQREYEVGPEFDFTESTRERLKESLTVNRYVGGVEILSNQGGGARMGYTVFGVSGVAPTLTSSQSRHYERYRVGQRYRRLTHIEYARLQGFPDNHCGVLSPYGQYAFYGNAVPPPMAEWALRRLLYDAIEVGECRRFVKQRDLFASL